MSAAFSMRGAAAGAALAIDFSRPVAVLVLARAAGIDAARLQNKAKRKNFGLVDVAPPLLGGRFAWVTGSSAKIFLEAAGALRLALHPASASN